MMCILFIKRHINKLAPTEFFSTRDMLVYGVRATVDSALSRLVKNGTIKRMARGIFVRRDDVSITVLDIAKAKMRAFKKDLIEPAIIDSDSFLPKNSAPDETDDGTSATYHKSGHSSSFSTVRGRVEIKGMCERKLTLVRDRVGQATLALWKQGQRLCTPYAVWQAARGFNRKEKSAFRQLSSVMPAWLQEMCDPYFPKPLATF